MSDQLDSFEARLLNELRQIVAETQPADTAPEKQARRFASPRLVVVSAAAIVLVAGVLLAPGLGSSPAYSVGEGNAGEIRVEINRPEGSGMVTSVSKRSISVTSPPGTIRDGETFVLAWSVVPLEGGLVDGFSTTLDFDIAPGPVSPSSRSPSSRTRTGARRSLQRDRDIAASRRRVSVREIAGSRKGRSVWQLVGKVRDHERALSSVEFARPMLPHRLSSSADKSWSVIV